MTLSLKILDPKAPKADTERRGEGSSEVFGRVSGEAESRIAGRETWHDEVRPEDSDDEMDGAM